MQNKATKVAIIGAGPAGMACALQLQRYGVDFILFDKDERGSLLRNARRVENYLGFDGISGVKLLEVFRQQLVQRQIAITYEEVKNLELLVEDEMKSRQFADYNFAVQTSNASYLTRYVVLASGTKPRQLLQLKNIARRVEAKVFYEVFPLLGLQKKQVAVVGAGDAAFDYALNLAENNEIFIFNASSAIKALPLLAEKASMHKNIHYYANWVLRDVQMDDGDKLICAFNHEGKDVKITADYLLVATGREAQEDFCGKNLIGTEKRLFTDIQRNESANIFLIGDVKNALYRQVTIAVGDGIRAAMQINHELRK